MKFRNKKKKSERKRGSRGPAPTVTKDGASIFPLLLPDPFRERYKEFVERSKEHKVKVIPMSVIFRIGGERYLTEKEKELNAAVKGRFHAKIRKLK